MGTIKDLVPWIIAHGYILMLIVATFEGTIITIAAGVAVGLGYFDLWIVYIIAILGDVIGDTIYYLLGYYTHNLLNSRLARFVGLTPGRMENLKSMLHKNLWRTVFLIKISIGALGIVAIGAVHVPFRSFLKRALVICFPKSLLFVLLGFYSARSYVSLSDKVEKYNFVLLGLTIIIIGILIMISRKAKKQI